MSIAIRLLQAGDDAVLSHCAEGVFDKPIDARLTREFLNDPRHHLAVAIEDGVVVGMTSAVNYVHPDKPRQLWINEVGVAPSHHRRGIGRLLMKAMLDHARSLGCTEAWVLTDRDNDAAIALYESAGGTEMPGRMLGFEFPFPRPRHV